MFDVAELTRECREAAADEVSSASDDELLATVVGLHEALAAVETTLAHVLGELHVRGTTDRCFGVKTTQWVAAEAKVDRRGVFRRLRLGSRLRPLTMVDAAVVDGTIGFDHAAALVEAAANPRIGQEIVAVQAMWVDLAATTSFVDWKQQLDHTVAELDQDGGYDPNRDLARNKLRLVPFPDGSVNLAGELVGEQALVIRQCVEAHADRLFLRLKHDRDLCPELPLPTRATVLAMALAELVLRGSSVDLENSTGPACDVTLVVEATKPDCIDRTDRGVGSGGAIARPEPIDLRVTDAGPRSDDPGDRDDVFDPYRLADPADRARWGDRADGVGLAPLIDHCGPATTPDGFHVHRDVAECLLCDPVITALIVDVLGVPLDMGREVRLANRRQRRALERRDGGCIFPGCDAPVGWCDAHHVTWWDDDGPTDIKNLALLCRYHHGVTHRSGWTMTAAAGQRFTWTTPLGQTLHSQRHRGRSPTGQRRQLQPA